jgi:chromosome segregation ATPase
VSQQLEESREALQDAEQKVVDLREESVDVRRQLDQKECTLQAAFDEHKEALQVLETLRNRVSQYERLISAKDEEMTSTKAELERRLGEANTELERKKSDLSQIKERYLSRNHELQQHNEQLEAQMESRKNDLTRAEQQIDNLNEQINGMSTQLSRLEEERDARKVQAEASASEKREQVELVTSLQAQASEQTERVGTLEKELADTRRDAKDARSSIEAQAEKIHELTTQKDKAQERERQLSDELQNLRESLSTMRQEQQKRLEAESTLSSKESELSQMKSDLESLRTEHANASKASAEAQAKVDNVQLSLNKAQAELDEERQRRENAEASLKDTEQQADSSAKELHKDLQEARENQQLAETRALEAQERANALERQLEEESRSSAVARSYASNDQASVDCRLTCASCGEDKDEAERANNMSNEAIEEYRQQLNHAHRSIESLQAEKHELQLMVQRCTDELEEQRVSKDSNSEELHSLRAAIEHAEQRFGFKQGDLLNWATSNNAEREESLMSNGVSDISELQSYVAELSKSLDCKQAELDAEHQQKARVEQSLVAMAEEASKLRSQAWKGSPFLLGLGSSSSTDASGESVWTYLHRVSSALADAAAEKDRKDSELQTMQQAYKEVEQELEGLRSTAQLPSAQSDDDEGYATPSKQVVQWRYSAGSPTNGDGAHESDHGSPPTATPVLRERVATRVKRWRGCEAALLNKPKFDDAELRRRAIALGMRASPFISRRTVRKTETQTIE